MRGSLTTDDLPAYIEALGSEDPEHPSEPLEIALPEALASPTMVEEPVAGATAVVVRPGGAAPVDVEEATKAPSQPIAEGAPMVPAMRVVQIDGVSTPFEQDPQSSVRRPVEDYERTQLRVRGSKLTSALRTLVTYENMLAGAPGLSSDEVGRLTRIAAVVEGILARSNVGTQNISTEK